MSQAAIISKAQGSVSVIRGGKEMTLTQGDALFVSDTIKTTGASHNTSVELVFADGSIATLGPNTVMSIADFTFDNTEAPSFVVNLAVGAMRTISGKVVESNPDAFKLITPSATVGIRGTDFLTVVNETGVAKFVLSQIDQGHTLIVTSHIGNQLSLTIAGQAVSVQVNGELVPQSFTLDEVEQFLMQLANGEAVVPIESAQDEDSDDDSVDDTDDDANNDTESEGESESEGEGESKSEDKSEGESKSEGEATPQAENGAEPDAEHLSEAETAPETAPESGNDGNNTSTNEGNSDADNEAENDKDESSYNSDTDNLRREEALTEDYSERELATGSHTEHDSVEQNTDVELAIPPADVLESALESVPESVPDDVPPPVTEETVHPDGYVDRETDGRVNYFGDEADNVDTSTSAPKAPVAHRITITEDMHTHDVIISGDVSHVTAGMHVTGADDMIIAKNMSAGTIVGDAAIVAATLIGGNDQIFVHNKTGGDSIYGDAKEVTGGTVSFGDDSITVNGNFVNSTIGGDAGFVERTALVKVWGSDHIVVLGNMGDAAQHTEIYGDAAGGHEGTGGGHDTIDLRGMLSSQSYIFGGVGNDTIKINAMNGGEVHGGAGADSIYITTGAASQGQALIDVGADVGADAGIEADSIYLSGGGGHITLKNFTVGHDKLIVNGVEQQVTSGGKYDDYHLIIEGLGDPTLSIAPTALSLSEDVALPYAVQGKATWLDPETGANTGAAFGLTDPHAGHMSTTQAGLYGSMSIDHTGLYTYTLNPNTVQFLAHGESRTEVFTVYTEAHGDVLSQQVSVHIIGENDAPVLTVQDVSVTERASQGTASFTSVVVDPDAGDITMFSVAAGSVPTTLPNTPPTTNEANATYGTLTIDETTGTYTYTLDPNKAHYIASHGQVTETFTVYVTDTTGEFTAQKVTVTVTGDADSTISYAETASADGFIQDFNALPESFVIQEHDGSAHSTYGDTIIDINADMDINGSIYGDSQSAGTQAGTGGADSITIANISHFTTRVYGDTENITHDNFVAGSDSITVNGEISGFSGVYGDAHTASDNAVLSGNDKISVNSMSGGTIYGDAYNASGDAELSGNDTITVNDIISDTVIFGDGTGYSDSAIYGDARNVSDNAVLSGNDSITVNSMSGFSDIYGDAYNASGNAILSGSDTITVNGDMSHDSRIFGDTCTASGNAILSSNDTITVNGNMSGVIYGEALVAEGNAKVSGNDSVTVNGEMSGGTICGDALHAYDNAELSGTDTITVKSMSDGNIYGDAHSSNGNVTILGSDNITVGSMSGGNIYGDAAIAYGHATLSGNDSITVNNMSGFATIYGDASQVRDNAVLSSHDTITVNGDMSNGFIYGDAYNTYGHATLSGIDSITVNGDMSGNATIRGDAIIARDNAVLSGTDTITVNGDMSDNAKIYGDVYNAYGNASVTGTDTIIIKGAMSAGTIYTDAAEIITTGTYDDKDSVTIEGGMTGGTIHVARGTDTITISGGTGSDIVTIDLSIAKDATVILDAGGEEGDTLNFTTGYATSNTTVYIYDADTTTQSRVMVGGTNIAGALYSTGSHTEGGVTYTLATAITSLSSDTHNLDATTDAFGNAFIRLEMAYDNANYRLFGDNLQVTGGVGDDDIIILNGEMYNGSIAGDTEMLDESNQSFVAGEDSIVINGNMSGGDIYGDARVVENDAATLIAADTVTVDGDMSGGSISGDASYVNGNVVLSGEDEIIITGHMSDGIIYGDANSVQGNGKITGADTITISSMGKGLSNYSLQIYGDVLTANENSQVSGSDTITVLGDMNGGSIYGDVSSVRDNASVSGNDTITIGGNMITGDIYGDAQTVTTTGTLGGDDRITINGVMSGSSQVIGGGAYIDAGAGNDTITVGGVGKGATAGTITGGEGNDAITVFVGDTGSRGHLIIDANGMHFTDESIALHHVGTSETYVSIKNLDADVDYADKTFTVGGVDITSHVELALDNNEDSYTHGDLIIYFK